MLTEDINVSVPKCISMNVAGITLDHLQITAAVSTVLTYIGQYQLCTITRQTHPVWHAVCCNTFTVNTLQIICHCRSADTEHVNASGLYLCTRELN